MRLPVNDKIPEHDQINWPLTNKSVEEFHDSFGELRLNGYEIANEHFVKQLNKILDNTASYSELKKELTEFVRNREQFAEFLRKSFDGKTGQYHI